MLINNAFYTMPADRVDQAEAQLHELRTLSRSEPGCLTFNVARSIENPTVFILYEEYRDQRALDVHFASDHFQRLVVNGIRKLALERIGYQCNEL
jgi:quinol monooxygenase YgiN